MIDVLKCIQLVAKCLDSHWTCVLQCYNVNDTLSWFFWCPQGNWCWWATVHSAIRNGWNDRVSHLCWTCLSCNYSYPCWCTSRCHLYIIFHLWDLIPQAHVNCYSSGCFDMPSSWNSPKEVNITPCINSDNNYGVLNTMIILHPKTWSTPVQHSIHCPSCCKPDCRPVAAS